MTDFDKLYKKHTTPPDISMLKVEFIDLLNACFDENPDIKMIGIIGETPSFNDGDICAHENAVFIMGEDYASGQISIRRGNKASDIVFGDSDVQPKFPKSVKISTVKKVKLSAVNRRIKKLLEYQTISQGIYETNYLISINRDNGFVDINHQECYPGY